MFKIVTKIKCICICIYVRGRGGVYMKTLTCYQVPCDKISSFEALTFKLGGPYTILFAIICRPATGCFLAELQDFLSILVLNYDRVVLCGTLPWSYTRPCFHPGS